MTDSHVIQIKTPEADALNELLKQGAQQLLAKAVEAELRDSSPPFSHHPVATPAAQPAPEAPGPDLCDGPPPDASSRSVAPDS